ncbi:MAG: class I SAM-dependent methyltransferase [Corallococcus sp.]|nr:class I SAM-dependent methyltransferase [Corallococcus sp.]
MLTKRLRKLVDVIPVCDVLADVGCDHGYVGIEALKRNVARKVIFVDISEQCLEKARKNLPAALNERAEFVCRDGLGDIVCDTAVICGMGGMEIISVLDGAYRAPQNLVLQPMRNVPIVRDRLTRDYEITLDEKIEDGKFYDVIVAKRSGRITALNDLQREFGLSNLACPSADFVRYLRCEQHKLNTILGGCDAEEAQRKLALVNRALQTISGGKL